MSNNSAQLQNANFDFALKLYQALSSNGDKNLIVSPFSVSISMAMVLLGSEENTAKEIKKGLALSRISDKEVNAGSLEILQLISSLRGNLVLETANRLFAEKRFTLNGDFVQDCNKFYQVEIESLEFAENPEQSRLHINEWVQKQTKDRIKDLLPSGSINSLVKLVLANAVFFKGNWMHKFNAQTTQLTDFYVNENKTVKVNMMTQKKKFKISYSNELRVQVLELPYEGNNVSMILIVPSDHFGLQEVERKITFENLNALVSEMSREDVIVSLPQMKIEYEADLVPTLESLGIHDLFNADKANLQKISCVPNLYVSGVFHKAFVEVNEEGSEAAAATAVVIQKRSLVLPVKVTCNHPFMFLIRHNPTQSVLFAGRFLSPSA